MAEQAGLTNLVYWLAGTSAMTNATGVKINAVDDSSWQALCELLEITQFGDTYRNRMAGIKDTKISISGNYDPADTNGQVAMDAGVTGFIGIYPQGSGVAGKQVKAIIESFEIKATAPDKQTFSASLVGIAAPVALPLRP